MKRTPCAEVGHRYLIQRMKRRFRRDLIVVVCERCALRTVMGKARRLKK